jgi:hypothetical protein
MQPLPRYYTRFTGSSGLAAGELAAFALQRMGSWERRIEAWQKTTLQHATASGAGAAAAGIGCSTGHSGGTYYDHQLFNELYFLADGGTVWLDSSEGRTNQHSSGSSGSGSSGDIFGPTTTCASCSNRRRGSTPGDCRTSKGLGAFSGSSENTSSGEIDLLVPLTSGNLLSLCKYYSIEATIVVNF